MRFALLEAKLALANIVRKFTILPSDKTKEPLVLDPQAQIAYPKDGLYIKLEKRYWKYRIIYLFSYRSKLELGVILEVHPGQ